MYGSYDHFKDTLGHEFDHSMNVHKEKDTSHMYTMMDCPQDFNFELQVGWGWRKMKATLKVIAKL